MNPIEAGTGRQRAVVDYVEPSVDGGVFPVKHRHGEPFTVIAHVLADGHDQVDVVVAYRRVGEPHWRETALHEQGNDVFSGTFFPESTGLYEFRVLAWIDPFRNWHAGFIKKSDSGDSKIGVELDIGAGLIRAAAGRSSGAEADQLKAWASFIGDHTRDLLQKVALTRDPQLYHRVHCHPDRSQQTVSSSHLLLVERERAFFSTWYEFFPRSCSGDPSRHGTFRDAVRNFPEIARMGFDIVYFPPIHPIGLVNRKGRNNALEANTDDVGSPWAIGSRLGGHKSIHPDLGTFEDFRFLLEEARQYGLEVALDIAFQCSPDHPYVREHPEWFKWRPDGSVQYAENPPKKYQDILPFNFETEDWRGLWQELKSIFEFWIEAGVRIFRVDNPHTKPMEFWRWCLLDLKSRFPDVLFLSEAFTRPKRKYRLAKAGFTQGYTYFTWRNRPAAMREYVEELASPPVNRFFLPNFWPNTPDILHEDLQNGNRATFMGRYILAATLSSNTGIYGPAFELMEKEPFPGKEEYNHNEKYELKVWDWDRPGNLKSEIARVNHIRRVHPALQQSFRIRFVDSDNPNLLAYLKQARDGSDPVLVVVNFDWFNRQSGFLNLPLSVLGLGSDRPFSVVDLYDPSNPEYAWRGARNFVELDPRKQPAHLFALKF